jgi:hypothetical protein
MVEASEPRRALLIALGVIGAGAVAACSREADDDKPSAAATLANHDKIVEALGDLSAAVDGLEQSVNGFDDENWRDVVPEVKTAAASVLEAFDDLKGLMAGSGVG